MRFVLPLISFVTLAACQQATPPAEPVEESVIRPSFSLMTDEAYDFEKIPPYLENHQAVYNYIDENLDSHLGAIQRWLRQPSISAQNVGITAEGEEELGSPHYPQIVDAYEDRLKTADTVLFPFNSQRPDGTILGVKGIIYFEMIAKGGEWGGPADAEIHGSYKAILPHQATAKVDSRLPPDIDPDEAMAKIRTHLDDSGFTDIEIRQLGGYPAAQTSVDAPAVQAALGVFKKYASDIAVQPRVAGSAPFYQFTDRLGLPLVPAGLGFGTGAHAPNEIMLIEPGEGTEAAGLADVEKAYVDFVYSLAE
jgi:acetylornithine deacetylase/succinyl-diaminopimelate desuccinylase-like protein